MTDRMFGRRGLKGPIKTRVFRAEIQEPIEVVMAKPKMTGGQIALAIFGTLVALSILGHSMRGDDVKTTAGVSAPAKVAAQTDSPKKCGATLAEFQALQIGITLGTAVGIIGCRGTEMSRVAYGGQETVMISWDGEGFMSNMNATFDNGRLIAKAQLGLE